MMINILEVICQWHYLMNRMRFSIYVP